MASVSVNININKNITGDVAKACGRALEICGGMAESYAKMRCPVDTGNLRNSITHQQKDDTTELIGTAVEYAPYVELGTYKMSARPYLVPALEEHIDEYKNVILTELNSI